MKILEYLKKRKENYKKIIENIESANCPYCSKKYTPKEIYKLEYETDIKDFSTIKCTNCDNLFGVKVKRYHEPSTTLFRNSIKITK